MKATYKNKIIAESNETVVVDNNHYFPAGSVKVEYLQKSGSTYQCKWKGVADYYNVTVDGETLEDAAWVYPEPTDAAKQIKGHFAFWKDIQVAK